MRVLVVYESMYGNTRVVAEAVARGLGPQNQVTVVPVARARADLLDSADLVVVGGPTHVHGMSRANTRHAAAEQAGKPGSRVTLETVPDGPGVRDWIGSLGPLTGRGAAFDTRLDSPALISGRASKGIARALERHGLTLVSTAKSFRVTTQNRLCPGEEDRAYEWGRDLAVYGSGPAGLIWARPALAGTGTRDRGEQRR